MKKLNISKKGYNNEDLSTDCLIIGELTNPTNVLLHTSGIHGIEGYVGSAIQCSIIKYLDKNIGIKLKESKTCLIIVHCINPYGMSWYRRWNENNVDLNRNFILDNTHTSKQYHNNTYAQFKDFIYPGKPIDYYDFFYLKAAYYILMNGYNNLKQTLAGGQYEFNDGLFYGGNELQPSSINLINLLKDFGINKNNNNLKKIIHIDVHTGLGPEGFDTLLFDENEKRSELETIFGIEHLSTMESDNSVAYKMSGGSTSVVSQLLGETNVNSLCITQEFGTVKPLIILQALRTENAAWQINRDLSIESPEKQEVLKSFYLNNDDHWKSLLIERGNIVFKQAFKFLDIEL